MLLLLVAAAVLDGWVTPLCGKLSNPLRVSSGVIVTTFKVTFAR
jgi:hypothetical protein